MGAHEGVGWEFGVDDGNHVAVLEVETAEHVEYLVGLKDGLTNVTEVVGERFELVQ